MADNPENPPKKKPRFECHDGPDVIVVVGGKEFEEYSHSLRCWSGYFDAAFRSGMKESATKRFEFPDKDPKEWELIRSIFLPIPEKKIDEGNYHLLYPWFMELCSNPGMHECENVVIKMVDKVIVNTSDIEEPMERDVEKIVSAIENCNTWTRDDAKQKAVKCLKKDLLCGLYYSVGRQVPRILSLLVQYDTLREALWKPLKKYLPDTDVQFDEGKMKELLTNPVLDEFIKMKIWQSHTEEGLQKMGRDAKENRKKYSAYDALQDYGFGQYLSQN